MRDLARTLGRCPDCGHRIDAHDELRGCGGCGLSADPEDPLRFRGDFNQPDAALAAGFDDPEEVRE